MKYAAAFPGSNLRRIVYFTHGGSAVYGVIHRRPTATLLEDLCRFLRRAHSEPNPGERTCARSQLLACVSVRLVPCRHRRRRGIELLGSVEVRGFSDEGLEGPACAGSFVQGRLLITPSRFSRTHILSDSRVFRATLESSCIGPICAKVLRKQSISRCMTASFLCFMSLFVGRDHRPPLVNISSTRIGSGQ